MVSLSDQSISTDPRVRVDVDGGVATITVDRPDKLNALDLEMVLALEAACYRLETVQGLRVAILTGAGDKAFCAGGDIAAWSGYPALEFGQVWVRHGHRMFDALARLRVPLIAVLNGHTLGGGLELAATADFRIAEQHIKLGQPETGLGIIPGWSGTQRMVRRFGAQIVRRMALAGEVLQGGRSAADRPRRCGCRQGQWHDSGARVGSPDRRARAGGDPGDETVDQRRRGRRNRARARSHRRHRCCRFRRPQGRRRRLQGKAQAGVQGGVNAVAECRNYRRRSMARFMKLAGGVQVPGMCALAQRHTDCRTGSSAVPSTVSRYS